MSDEFRHILDALLAATVENARLKAEIERLKVPGKVAIKASTPKPEPTVVAQPAIEPPSDPGPIPEALKRNSIPDATTRKQPAFMTKTPTVTGALGVGLDENDER